MSGPYTALHTDVDAAGVAYMRRASASFDGYHLNIHLKNIVGGARLYESVFLSSDILWSQPVSGHPSVYRLGLNTGSGSYSDSLVSANIDTAVGVPVGGPDPLAGKNILPHGIVAELTDTWADPFSY